MSSTAGVVNGFAVGCLCLLWLTTVAHGAAAPATAPEVGQVLRYHSLPEPNWDTWLPIGNGTIGTLIPGRPESEELFVTHVRMREDKNQRLHLQPGMFAQQHARLRALVKEGKFDEALQLCYTTPQEGIDQFEPVGQLLLEIPAPAAAGAPAAQVTDYERTLDLGQAIAEVRFRRAGVQWTRQYLASYPQQVIAVRIATEPAGALDLDVKLRRQSIEQVAASAAGANAALLDISNERFCILAKVIATGGSVAAQPGREAVCSVRAATEVLVLVAAATHHESKDLRQACLAALDKAPTSFAQLRAAHVKDYRALYDRVRFELAYPDLPADAALDTDQLVRKAWDNPQAPHLLVKQLFDYGRYLTIASSRPGSWPSNLQGLWAGTYTSPWSADYHVNINLQMNYWPVEVCNLTECTEPLFRFCEDMVPSGRDLAGAWNARGVYFAHATHGYNAFSGQWTSPSHAAWLARHFWEHWLYTGDRQFLAQRAYPFLKEAALFLVDYAHTGPDGKIVLFPSASPENGGRKGLCDFTSTHDLVVFQEVLTNLIAASEILGVDAAERAGWKATLARLPAPRVQDGVLKEWSMCDTGDPGHRHLSHLYGVFPAELHTAEATPELFEASRKALVIRGAGRTGWGCAHRACMWARFGEGDKALSFVHELTKEHLLPNLFDAHNRRGLFQTDGNFGACAAVAEMLLQSHGGLVRVLPALPTVWPQGSFRGLVARGGFVVDAAWQDGKITALTVHSRRGGECRVRLDRPPAKGDIERGKVVTIQTKPRRNYALVR